MNNDTPLLTVREVARWLRVSRNTVLRLIMSGELAAMKVGRGWRVNRLEVERYMREVTNDRIAEHRPHAGDGSCGDESG